VYNTDFFVVGHFSKYLAFYLKVVIFKFWSKKKYLEPVSGGEWNSKNANDEEIAEKEKVCRHLENIYLILFVFVQFEVK
jgi:hypothetical protein